MPNRDILQQTKAESPSAPPTMGTTHLLVFAIDDYTHCPKLNNSVKDAKELIEVLGARYGISIDEALPPLFNTQATKDNIIQTFRSLIQKTSQKDNVIVYFSGHGEYDKVSNQGFWVPVEAEKGVIGTYLSNSDVLQYINSIDSLHTFLMVDSCFSGTLFTTESKAFSRSELEASRWALTSGRNEIVSDGEVGSNSPFAESLLYQLRTKDGAMGVDELCARVREHVEANSNQSPIGQPLRVNGHRNGLFVFRPKNSNPATSDPIIVTKKTAPPTKPLVIPPGMILIPAGTFDMGDVMLDKESTNELPIHRVTLDAFCLGQHAVTFAEYDAFCEATGREKPDDHGWGRGKHPVINVSWYDAVYYCNWRNRVEGFEQVYADNALTPNWNIQGYRLPTEAEWEYAAREGGKRLRFGNGKNTADPGTINFDGSARDKKSYSIAGEYLGETVEVGSLPPNALGLYEMSGNVCEWCWDWYGNYPPTTQSNPKGPDRGSFRVHRGSSWSDFADRCRVTYRCYEHPVNRRFNLGFRIAFDPGKQVLLKDDLPSEKIKSDQDAVWLATVILSFQRFEKGNISSEDDFYFRQEDIRSKASEIKGKKVASPQVNEHCVVERNRPSNPNYLIYKGRLRRLKATNERPTSREKPDNIEEYKKYSIDGIHIEKLVEWVDTVYSKWFVK